MRARGAETTMGSGYICLREGEIIGAYSMKETSVLLALSGYRLSSRDDNLQNRAARVLLPFIWFHRETSLYQAMFNY